MNLNRSFVPAAMPKNDKEWRVIDAAGKTMGRLATEIATLIRGKHTPMYSPHVDTGVAVVVINAEKIYLTGNKRTDKWYHIYTGYRGNDKQVTVKEMMQKDPAFVLEHAIKGMMRKNRLERQLFDKFVKVYAGSHHPHIAQVNSPA
jgi:large subunit ribosomal protein L13